MKCIKDNGKAAHQWRIIDIRILHKFSQRSKVHEIYGSTLTSSADGMGPKGVLDDDAGDSNEVKSPNSSPIHQREQDSRPSVQVLAHGNKHLSP